MYVLLQKVQQVQMLAVRGLLILGLLQRRMNLKLVLYQLEVLLLM